jgi:hypothetical protein
MSIGAGRTPPFAVAALCALALPVLLAAAPGNAYASVNAILTASDCSGSSCSNFRVTLWGSTIKPNRTGKVCFKGKCVKNQSNSEGVLFADFNATGPYRNGSKTSTRLTYGGRSYKRNVWVNCGC